MKLTSRSCAENTFNLMKCFLVVLTLSLFPQPLVLFGLSNTMNPKLAWTVSIPAFVTEMEVAAESGNIAASAIYDVEKGQGDNRLYYFNKFGRKIWDYLLPAQTRTLEISVDGAVVLMSLRNDTLVAVSGTGKKLWERRGTCRAFPIRNAQNQIESLCFYDDDTESPNTVEWIDSRGEPKKKFSYGTESPDALGFAINPDWKSFLVWFPSGKIVWQSLIAPFSMQEFQTTGTIIRAQFHPDGKRLEALALDQSAKSRLWTQWDLNSMKQTQVLHIIQSVAQWTWVESTLFLYGNAKAGQILYYAKNPSKNNAKWLIQLESRPGNYHALLQTDSCSKMLITAWQREIRALDSQGKVTWVVADSRDEGNFLIHFFIDRTVPHLLTKQLVILGEENQIKAFSIP